MPLLREMGSLDRYPYLAGLGLDPDDAGRLDVVAGPVDHTGFFIDAASGESRLVTEGDRAPVGVWIAQRDIDDIKPGPTRADEPHGFGEGWGTQGPQIGGDQRGGGGGSLRSRGARRTE
jgi:hypothetical protein